MTVRSGEGLTTTVRTLFCGFGPGGQSAARLLLRRGQAPMSMRVLESDPDRSAAAGRMGIPWLRWRVDELPAFLGPSVTRVIVELEGDLQVEPLVRCLRAALPDATITVAVRDPSTRSAVLQSGASAAVSEAALAGALLAATVAGGTPIGSVTH